MRVSENLVIVTPAMALPANMSVQVTGNNGVIRWQAKAGC